MTMKDIHTGKLLSASMKMAELPDIDSGLLGVMRRLGIRFGFGERTVSEVCAENKINPNTLLLICKIYISDNYVPSEEELSKNSIGDIVTYLHNSHDFYTGNALANLENDVKAMADTLDEKHRKIIMKFYSEYKAEILKHFEYEEKTVFPYIMTLENGAADSNGYNIDKYEEIHSDIDEKLNDLKSIVIKYMPSTCDDNLIQNVLARLYAFEHDISKHTFIEDGILIPMIASKERELRESGKINER